MKTWNCFTFCCSEVFNQPVKKEATNWRLAFKLLSTKPSLAFLFLPFLFSVACNLFLPVCFCHLPLCLDLPLPACPFVYQQPIWVLFSSLPMTLVPSNIGWLCLCLSVYNLSLLGSLFHSINWPVSVSTEVEHVSTEYNIVLRLVENVFIFLHFCSKNSIILCLFSFLFVSVLFSLILFFLFLFIFLRFILALSLTANKK